jgi:Tol biopolymer transport system component
LGARLRTAVGACLVALMVAAPSAHAAFPGVNGKIAFASTRTGNYDIYTMNADGTGVTNLTNDAAIDQLPAWSPDGQRIAFLSNRGGSNDVWVMNADGTGMTQVTQLGNVGRPAWSPDGKEIAFTSGDGDLYTVDADGTNYNLLDAHFCDDEMVHCTYFELPSWSPDGKTIDYVGSDIDYSGEQPVNVQLDIWSVPAAGGSHTDVTNTPNFDETAPDWSPDGRAIAFNGGPSSGRSQIWTMTPDGANRTQLTNDPTDATGAAWSPDESRVAFETHRDGNYEVYVMNADGSGQTNLTRNGTTDYEPSWQPIPNGPPDCSGVAASRPVLATANHRLVPITLDGATDPNGDPVTLSVDGVTQDEPVVGSGDNTSPDAVDQGDGQLRVRAERNPHGDGRVYRIAFMASDGRGGSCSGTATVSVPRKARKAAIDSAPPSYDSLVR